ncbi:SDR family oxidoreductase [Siminovitchia terrae]|uniref:SDR family oxidoreductase n=1 Tax=Siminovitchia terrae TaxID=1914933 RepID=A0A429XB60_SIMTE|nr:SDR family oxidoreductase [Siminovitchia terrae]RST60313.1 SDR family oxidoreductase [Siminovitchia terrae]GIN89761.1 short-chain dehydrogenase/reductase [Siminovitchia terrae]
MNSQTVLITGASSGFGLLTAIELAKKGFFVIATMRNMEKSAYIKQLSKESHVEGRLEYLQLDVASTKSVENFSYQLRDLPPIDILINNAGFALGGFCEDVSLIEYKEQFETNFFGVISVTQVVLPYMRQRKKGKIINVSSISGRVGFPGLSPYAASKNALEGWSECLRLEVKPFGIDVALIEPGSFKTSIWSTGKKIAEKSKADDSPYGQYMNAIESELEQGQNKLGDPEEVVQLVVKLCKKKDIRKLRYPIGSGVKTALFLKNILPWTVWEKVFFKKLKIK